MPVAVAHIGKRKHMDVALPVDGAGLDEDILGFRAVRAAIHPQSASDRTRNAAVKRKTSDSSIGGRTRNFHIWHSGADAQAVAGFRFDVREAAPQPDDNARNAAVPDQKVRAESDDGYRQVGRGSRKEIGEILLIGRREEELCRPPDAKPCDAR